MADHAGDDESMQVPSDDIQEWIQERAAAADVSPGTLLRRYAAAYRAAEEGDAPEPAAADAVQDLETEVESLADAVDELDAALEEKIRDVRDRVVQVKREADAKADADHDHTDLRADVETAAETATEAAETAESVEADLDGLRARVDEGFENYEDILEYVTDSVADLDEKTARLARAILSLRKSVERVAAREERRMAADRIREQANTEGVRHADCGECGSTLDVSLLVDARCPHCGTTFTSVEPKRGFFGTPTLVTGDRPALESAPDVEDELDVSDVAADGNGVADAADEPDFPGDATDE